MPSDPPKRESRDPSFHLARALAIEQYAKLESALSHLLATLLGTTLPKASIVFFNLINTRSRNSIFESLVATTHGDQYDVYWNGKAGAPGVPRVSGLLTLIRQIDKERNRIVHWHTTILDTFQIEAGSGPIVSEQLVKPEFWFRDPLGDPASIQAADLEAFTRKTDFVTKSVMMFRFFTDTSLPFPEDARPTWSQIFQQPVPYPPSDTHPLSPNYKAPNIPPRSSRA